MKFQPKIFLILILTFAFIIRVWQVGEIPTFISDEASIGYNAYSLLETGRDEWNNFLPLSFKSFGEYKLPLYIYSAVPSIAFFGLSETAIRLPSVLAGVAAIFLLFLLGRQLFSEKAGLLAALFLAINPWYFEVSRMALEANLGLTLVLAGVYFLLKKERQALFLSFFFFTLSFYTYNACRVFVPFFLFFFFLLQRRAWFKILKKSWLGVVMMLVLSLPIFFSGFQGSSQRLAKVGIFSDSGIFNRLIEDRLACLEENQPLLCQFVYNRPVRYSQEFIKNYLSHFSLNFLFIKGAGLDQYSVPERGVLYPFELAFLIPSIILLFKKKQRKNLLLLVIWSLTAPIANSLTGTAHPVRALVLLPVFPILSALGLLYLFSFIKRKKGQLVFGVVTGLVIFLFTCSYLKTYFFDYSLKPGSTWQAGYKSLYQKLEEREEDYDQVLVTKFYGEPHIFYLFYRQFDPRTYQYDEGVIRYERSDQWVNVDRIGKYYFSQDGIEIRGRVLYAVAPQEGSEGLEILEEIKWANGQPSFLIGQVK